MHGQDGTLGYLLNNSSVADFQANWLFKLLDLIERSDETPFPV